MDNYLQTCLNFFYFWAYNSNEEGIFHTPNAGYEKFCESIQDYPKSKLKSYFMEGIHEFTKQSQHKNPLDTLFSHAHNWDINSYLVVKSFIPLVLTACPDVKFKRIGCFLQTNNHFYLFSSMFSNLLFKIHGRHINNEEALEELMCVFLALRYRQDHPSQDKSLFEERVVEAFKHAYKKMNINFQDVIGEQSEIKGCIQLIREKLLSQSITNLQLESAVKSFQNILGKEAMTSSKKQTFFWQRYSDLQCHSPNELSSYEAQLFLHVYQEKNQFNIAFNKDYFIAFEKIGITKRLSPHKTLYVYILSRLYEKISKEFIRVPADRPKLTNFLANMQASEKIFKFITPHNSEFREYLQKNKKSIADVYGYLVDNLNNAFDFTSSSSIKTFLDYTLKEELDILDGVDLYELYKPYL